MSVRRALTATAAALVAGAVTASCGSPDTVASHTDDSGFRHCVDRSGLSLAGADDWSTTEQRVFMSRPAALGCGVDELDRGDLSGSMQAAFDGASKPAIMGVLTTFVEQARGADRSRARSVGRLLGSLDQSQFDPGWDTFAVRQQLAWAIQRHEDARARSVYERWLTANPGGRTSGATPDVPFLTFLEDSRTGSPAGRVGAAVSDLATLIHRAQDDQTT